MADTDARPLADAVWAVLDAITDVNTYDGEIVDDTGRPTMPPNDPDGRVHAYAIFYPTGGAPVVRRFAAAGSLAWGFQVTCAAGDRERLLWCVDKVRAALAASTLDVRELGDDAGRSRHIRRVDTVVPPRYEAFLDFGVYVNG